MLPFTAEQFFAVFEAYNVAIWPAQIVAYLLGIMAVGVVLRPSLRADRLISGILAAMWLWSGVVYQGVFFSTINVAAFVFAAMFAIQGLALLYVGVVRGRLRFGLRSGSGALLGAVFLAYAAILYPLIGIAAGHRWPAMPMFGVAPCPVTIFTLGLLFFTTSRFPHWLLVIPFVWALIGGSAAVLLDVQQDWALLLSGLVAVPLLVIRNRRADYVPA